MNNNIYKGDVQPNPKEYSVWVDSKGIIKTFDGNAWKVSSGGGIPVVDSEDKLEGLGLKQGEIAVVANTSHMCFSELYQPISTLPSDKPSDFDNWDAVTGITCEIPHGISDTSFSCIFIVPRTIYEIQSNCYMLQVGLDDGMPRVAVSDMYTHTHIDFTTTINGEHKINQSIVDEFNTILSSGDFVYAGLEEGTLTVIDSAVKLNTKIAHSDLYINNGSLFQKIVTQEGLEKEFEKKSTEKNKKTIELVSGSYPDTTTLNVDIRKEYTIIKVYGTEAMHIYGIPTVNEIEACEYIIEYYCFGSKLEFIRANIVWENDTPPAFEPNTIVRISIINGLATYKVFPMPTE